MESVASVNFTELDLWDHLWMASGGQGSWFLALGFLSWVGLRIGQNIYNNAETPIVMKLAGTIFSLFIAYGWLINFGASEWNANGVANAMAGIEASGQVISPYAAELIANNNPGEPFNLAPSLVQGLFILSITALQLLPMWIKK